MSIQRSKMGWKRDDEWRTTSPPFWCKNRFVLTKVLPRVAAGSQLVVNIKNNTVASLSCTSHLVNSHIFGVNDIIHVYR